MHRNHPPTAKERGQSLMEFALVLPILLLVFMAIFDFGRILFLYSQVMNGAREGARYGSVTGPNEANPQFRQCNNIRNAVLQGFGLPIAPDQILIEYDDGVTLHSFTCNPSSPPAANALGLGDRIRVTVTTSYGFITPGMSNLFPDMTLSFTSARTLLIGGTLVPPGSD